MKWRLPTRFTSLSGPDALRILVLMMVWGIAAFLWGSLGAWARHNAVEQNRSVVREQLERTRAWLSDAMAPVEKLAADERLQIAVTLPGGVESPPVLRVLYEFAYQHNAQDVYVVDLSDGATTQIAGAAKLRPELLERLKLMKGEGSLLVGAGERNGVIYVASSIKAPLPHRIFVLVPYTLGLLTATLPDLEDMEESKIGVLLPHTGGWAWWQAGEMRFSILGGEEVPGVGGGVIHREDGVLVTMPVSGLSHIWLGVLKVRLMDSVALLPQALLLLWAMTMTVIVIWKPIAPLRHKVVRPESPLARGLMSFGKGVAFPFTFVGGRIVSRLMAEREPPLIDGPGDFLPGDFGGPKAVVNRSGFLRPVERAVSGRPLHAQEVSKSTRGEGKLPDLQDMQRQQEERDMKEIIKRCLREGRMNLLYQPVFEASTNRPVMHEVFVRLIRPEGEMMTPAQFLPIANKFGLTQALDAAVFRKVLATHFAGGAEHPSTKMALNVGGTSLDGIAYLQELLSGGQHILKHLVFEVRSQEIVRDPRALKLLKDIQSYGGELSVDYFGGGDAMLSASKVMGFDYVKLDAGRFSGTPELRDEMAQLCRTAGQVGLPIVVEKIENIEMEDFCRAHGVRFLQGYGLSRPSEKVEDAALVRAAPGAAQVEEEVSKPQEMHDAGADKPAS